MKLRTHTHITAGLSILLAASSQSAEITWGTVTEITIAADISNPAGSTVIVAADFNTAIGTAVGDDNSVNGIPFVETPFAGSGNLVTDMNKGPAYGTTFFPNTTDDGDLDAMLDSHAYTSGDPSEVIVTINGLTVGNLYQVQLIGVGDGRTCCAGRTYEPDDGAGNYTTGVEMARGGYATVLGTFTADTISQQIMLRSLGGNSGNNDTGLSGLVVLEVQPEEDTDGDGLFDAWETANGLNPIDVDSDGDLILDGDEDEDMDGLTNLGEQAAGTDITKADTDDDGYFDGAETNTGVFVSYDPATNTGDTGSHPLNNDSDGDTLIDGAENPDLPYVDINQTGSDPNLTDTDGDTLPDEYEVLLNLNPNNLDTDGNTINDDLEDNDGDNSPNGQELARNTDPLNVDTDEDGYFDGAETNTGIFVSYDIGTDTGDTGTDPLNNDSDGDILIDGTENPDNADSLGTDPNIWDTDGDLRNDGLEISENSNPTDASDFTPLPAVSFRPGLVGADLTDPEDDGVDGEDTAGTNFNWVGITSSTSSFFSDSTVGGVNEGAFDIFDNKVGAGEAKWCCDGAPQDVTVEFDLPVSLTHFTITSSNDSPLRDPVDWEIQGSDDGVTFTAIHSNVGSSIWTARNQTALIILPSASIAYKFIRYSVTATGGTQHALGEIEYFGTAGVQDIVITDITYDQAANNITLIWTSAPGRTYTIFANTDLGDFIDTVGSPVLSGGNITSSTFPNPSPGIPKRFFVIKAN